MNRIVLYFLVTFQSPVFAQSYLDSLNKLIDSRNSINARFHRGKYYLDKGETRLAYDDFRFCQKEMPGSSEYIFFRALSEEMLGMLSKAEESYTKCLKVDNTLCRCLVNRAILRHDESRYKDAEKDYSACLKRYPDDDYALANRGLLYLETGKFEKAEADIRKAIKINPENHEAWINLGYLFEERNQADSALNCFRQVIKVKPGNSIGYISMANTYIDLKEDYDEALDILSSYLELQPEDAEVLVFRGDVQYQLDKFRASLRDLKKAQSIDSTDYLAFLIEGYVHSYLEDYNKAEIAFKRSLNLAPNDGEANFALAECMLQRKNSMVACQYAKKALSLGFKDAELFLIENCKD